jgi:tRNA(Ser,Leu) C12 N-acetylase TAN1
MPVKLKTGRITLEESAVESLNKILGALLEESSHLKASPSKVVSLILSDYEQKFFTKEKKGLLARLFDKRSYVKHLLQTTDSPDELVERISELHTEGIKKKKKSSPKGSDTGLGAQDVEAERS